MDVFELATLAVAAALAADRALERLSRLGRWPKRLRSLDIERAERLVEHRDREEALDKLAHQADAILAQLQPNGGSSLRDEVRSIQADLGQQRQIIERHIEYAQATDASTGARLELLTREVQRLDARTEVERLDRLAQSHPAAAGEGATA